MYVVDQYVLKAYTKFLTLYKNVVCAFIIAGFE